MYDQSDRADPRPKGRLEGPRQLFPASPKTKPRWKSTEIIFDIARTGGLTEVRLTHEGLVPEYECYEACSDGWSTYVNGSLRNLIATGKGDPNLGDPMNQTEQKLVG